MIEYSSCLVSFLKFRFATYIPHPQAIMLPQKCYNCGLINNFITTKEGHFCPECGYEEKSLLLLCEHDNKFEEHSEFHSVVKLTTPEDIILAFRTIRHFFKLAEPIVQLAQTICTRLPQRLLKSPSSMIAIAAFYHAFKYYNGVYYPIINITKHFGIVYDEVSKIITSIEKCLISTDLCNIFSEKRVPNINVYLNMMVLSFEQKATLRKTFFKIYDSLTAKKGQIPCHLSTLHITMLHISARMSKISIKLKELSEKFNITNAAINNMEAIVIAKLRSL